MKRYGFMGAAVSLILALAAPLLGADTPAPAAQAPTNAQPAAVSTASSPVPQAILQTAQSLVQIRIYGYVKLDGSYDTTRVQTGDIIYYVLPKNNGATDNRIQGSVIYTF